MWALTLSGYELVTGAIIASLWFAVLCSAITAVGARLVSDGNSTYAMSRVSLALFAVTWLVSVGVVIHSASTLWLSNDPTAGVAPWLASLVDDGKTLMGAAGSTAARWITWIWAAGALWCGGTLVRDARALQKCRSSGVPLNPQAWRAHHYPELRAALDASAITIVVSGRVSQPFAFGLWSRTIVISERARDGLHADECAAIIAHELAHFERRDPWLNAALQLARGLLWFNPAFALLAARYERSREFDCDRRACRFVAPKALARALGRLCTLPPSRRLSMSALGDGTSIADRMRSLMTPSVRAPRRAAEWGALVAALVLVGLSEVCTAAVARSLVFSRTRAHYLTGSMHLDLDELTYDVCSYLSSVDESSGQVLTGEPVNVTFGDDRLELNGRSPPEPVRIRLLSIFDKHGVRRGGNNFFRYHQSDSEIGAALDGMSVGERIGTGHWLDWN